MAILMDKIKVPGISDPSVNCISLLLAKIYYTGAHDSDVTARRGAILYDRNAGQRPCWLPLGQST